jgi:Leucine-rich repeat (LRR) protein
LALPVALTALPDMVPGQLPRLIELDLTHSIVEALLPSWCCNLQSLQRLVLNGAQLAGGDLPPEFAALQSLRHLELRACRLQALPQCVAALTGLTHLDLGINCLTDLPGRPMLASEHSLYSVTRCTCLPACPQHPQLNTHLLTCDVCLCCVPELLQMVHTLGSCSTWCCATTLCGRCRLRWWGQSSCNAWTLEKTTSESEAQWLDMPQYHALLVAIAAA